jgi:hypothetical protein
MDLSFNRISGEYKHAKVTQSGARISLEINRLSGPLGGASLAASNHLNILDGMSSEMHHLYVV